MKKLIVLIITLLSVFTLAACKENNFVDISNAELKEMLENNDDYQFIDVRTKEEYYNEHIPGFNRNVDFYKFEEDVTYLVEYINLVGLDKSKPVVIMCNSGNRSIDASNMFYDQGFTTVYNLKNGIQGWDGETE